MTCDAAQSALEALFLGELDGRAYSELRAHAAGCAGCKEQYERLFRVEATLEKARGGLSEARASLLEAELLARVQPAPAGAPRDWREWLMPLLGAAAALLVAIPLGRPAGGGEYQARGGEAPAFGLRAFCVEAGQSLRITAEARSGGRLACPVGSAIQLTYSAAREVRLSVVLGLAGVPVFPPKGGDAVVSAGTDVPLPFSTPVDRTWLAAPVRLSARFVDPATGGLLSEPAITLAP
ncbi:MAG: zf-HC2 domain-containing protein [Myxococcaceae bacterium]